MLKKAALITLAVSALGVGYVLYSNYTNPYATCLPAPPEVLKDELIVKFSAGTDERSIGQFFQERGYEMVNLPPAHVPMIYYEVKSVAVPPGSYNIRIPKGRSLSEVVKELEESFLPVESVIFLSPAPQDVPLE